MKLLLSTRPGGVAELEPIIYKYFDSTEVCRLPDLESLTPDQAVALAEEVLGANFRVHAERFG